MSLIPYHDLAQRGHEFPNLEAVRTYLRGYLGQKRYAILSSLRDRFMERMETMQMAVAQFYNLAIQDASFLAFAADNAEAWEPMRKVAISTRERITTARNSILKMCPEAAAQGLMPEGASFQTLPISRRQTTLGFCHVPSPVSTGCGCQADNNPC